MIFRHSQPGGLNARRSGFTLVELLVVIALIAVIASLGLLMFPGYSEREQVASGASRLQGAFNAAKTRALLDRAPRGVRLLPDEDPSVATLFYTQIQFLEQPEDFGDTNSFVTSPDGQTLNFINADLSGGDTTGNPSNWPVQNRDYIQIGGSGLMHQLINVGANSALLLPTSNLPSKITTPATFRIVRQPRVQADETLRMPANVGIDMNASRDIPFTAGQPLDIMFAPSGAVYNNASSASMKFLVRDYGSDDSSDPLRATKGEPTAIVLYPRTGFVASYDVLPDVNDLFGLVR